MQNSLNPAGYPTKRFQEKAFSELVSQSLPVCQAIGAGVELFIFKLNGTAEQVAEKIIRV